MVDDSTERSATAQSRRTFVKATGAATAAATLGVAGGGDAGAADAAGDGARGSVEPLLRDLSLEQKVGQMTQVAVGSFDPAAESIPDSFGVDSIGEYFSELGVGSILSSGAAPPSFDPQAVVEGVNALQEHNLAESEHGIPFLWGVDATHGNGLLEGATALPQRLNMGATRDPELLEAAERHTSESVAAMGAHWTFAPTADLQRDPRWGRFFEGISEAPKLTGDVSRARVRGIESEDRVTSCVKHFGAYSVPHNGNDRAPANASMRDLRTNLLPPYREALEAEPGTVMVNSGSVNGVPAHASEWLLTDVLRNRYGFEGVILSDWDDLHRMVTYHDYAPDFRTATKRAIDAGVDVYMVGNGGSAPGPAEFVDTVVSLVEDGELPRERIDDAARRVLELKRDLGVFEAPTVDESRIGDVVGDGRDASRRLARESLVLLENDDALPLSGSEDVLLTGPGVNRSGANTRPLMLHGGWTLGWQGPSAGGPYPRQSLLAEELESRVGSLAHVPTTFSNATWWAGQGDEGNQQSDENGDFAFTDEQESAVRSAASDADAAVVVLGEGCHNEGYGDRDELVLDESQQRLVDVVAAETDDSTPVVGVLLAGSPRGDVETFDRLDALLFAGQPGSDGGRAIAEALLGEYNPSGRLAFSWPRNPGTPVGTVPAPLNRYPPTSTGATDNSPLYPFGHGLSYTTFEYANLSVTPNSVEDPAAAETVTATVDVTNAGDVAGEHAVDVYNTQSYGSVLQPLRRLVGYERVSLAPGETRTVEVEVDLSALEVVPGDIPALDAKVVEPGDYELSVGDLTTTLTVERAGSITGDGPLASAFDRNDDGRITGRDLVGLIGQLRDGRDDGDEDRPEFGWSDGDDGPGRRDEDGPWGRDRDEIPEWAREKDRRGEWPPGADEDDE